MKNKVFFAAILLMTGRIELHAQSDSSQKPVKTGNEWKMPSDVFKRSRDFSNNLQKQLGLDSAQTRKVYGVYLENTKPLDEIGVLPISEKEKQSRLKANRSAFNEKLKGIFTIDQYQKYLKLQ